jgi:hypothetical protein
MSKNKNYIVAIILVVLFINVGFVYFGKKDLREAAPTVTSSSTNTKITEGSGIASSTEGVKKPTTLVTGNIAGFYSYANAQYNFSIQYPSYVRPLTSFATFHEIGNNWRLYASQANQGKSVVSFSIHNIDQGPYSTGKQTYPLYFTSEVRVGVSPNIKECYASDAGYTNQTITNVTINGVPFKRFSTSEGATMKYIQAESYRTIRNNLCYVIEQIRVGSSYRDEKMTLGKTDEQLMTYYGLGEKVVKTFKFTK